MTAMKNMQHLFTSSEIPLLILVVLTGPLLASSPGPHLNETYFDHLPLDDVLFTEDVLMEVSTRSRIECSKKCVKTEGCEMCTFHSSPQGPPGHCRLHSQLQTAADGKQSMPGARSMGPPDDFSVSQIVPRVTSRCPRSSPVGPLGVPYRPPGDLSVSQIVPWVTSRCPRSSPWGPLGVPDRPPGALPVSQFVPRVTSRCPRSSPWGPLGVPDRPPGALPVSQIVPWVTSRCPRSSPGGPAGVPDRPPGDLSVSQIVPRGPCRCPRSSPKDPAGVSDCPPGEFLGVPPNAVRVPP
ncbi:hypothetical protein ACOMHN_059719 [Nucella lapillus]